MGAGRNAPDVRAGAIESPGMILLLAAMLLAADPSLRAGAPPARSGPALVVPVVAQTPQRCGQAALEMVLRFYGADSTAAHASDSAYDPVLRGSLITDLAAAARRAGFEAEISRLTPDSLVTLLAEGVPPIVLYQSGSFVTLGHFGVVTAWDPSKRSFTLNDGGPLPRVAKREDFARRWQTAGSQALVVRRRAP